MTVLQITDIDQGDNRRRIIEKVAMAIEAAGWQAMADQYRNEPDKRERIVLFIGHKIAKKLGAEKGCRFVDFAVAAQKGGDHASTNAASLQD